MDLKNKKGGSSSSGRDDQDFFRRSNGGSSESLESLFRKHGKRKGSFTTFTTTSSSSSSSGGHIKFGQDNAYLKNMLESKMLKSGKGRMSGDFKRWMSTHAGSLGGEGNSHKKISWSSSWSSGGKMKMSGGGKWSSKMSGGAKWSSKISYKMTHMSSSMKAGMMRSNMKMYQMRGGGGSGSRSASSSEERKGGRFQRIEDEEVRVSEGKHKKRKKNKRKRKGKGRKRKGGCDCKDDNFCYILSDGRKSFSNAERDCKSMHGQLATVNSKQTKRLVSKFLDKKGLKEAIWFGLQQKGEDWVFRDNSRVDEKTFVDWEKGEPNDLHTGGQKGADCAVLWPETGGQWRDRSCNAQYRYICQRKLSGNGKKSGDSGSSSSSSSSESKESKEKGRKVCPKGSFKNSENGRCYKYYSKSLCWQDAFKYCLEEDGNLLVLDSKKTIDFLSKKITKDIWISYTDRIEEDKFVLHYGNTDQEKKFDYWRKGQPNGGRKQNCLMATGRDSLKAQDKACSEKKPFVCEFREQNDNAVDYSRVCRIKKGYKLKSKSAVEVDDIDDLDKCIKTCDERKTCLGFNFYKKNKKCFILSDNLLTVEKENLEKDNDCVFGGHRTRRFSHCPREADIRNDECGVCYRYFTEFKTWGEAQAACRKDGGQLAIVDNDKTYDFLNANSKGFKDVYFIAGNDLDLNGEFYWEWNDIRVPVGKSFWKKNQPNDPDQEQNCLAATADSKQQWQDKPCKEKRNFLCQYTPAGYRPEVNWLSGCDKYDGIEIKQKDGKPDLENVDVDVCARKCFKRKNCLAFDYNRNKKSCRFLRANKFTVPKNVAKNADVDHYVIKIRQYAHCPEGCVKLGKSDRCFEIHTDESNWESASKKCNRGRHTGNLLVIDSDEVNNLFTKIKKKFKKPFWTGCNRRGSRDFGWSVFGSQEKLGKLQKWRGGKPKKDEKKRCVRARNTDLEWEEEDCNNRLPFVCEYRPAGAVFTDDALGSFRKMHGKRLDVRDLEIIKKSTDADCANKCIADESCLSFNFNYEENQCELSERSRFTNPNDLEKKKGYVYYVHKGRQIGHCPSGCIINLGNNRCYQILDILVSWDDAQKECAKIGANLAVMPDRSTWKSLADQWPERSPAELWISMISDVKGEMKWRRGVKNFRVGKSFNNWEGKRESKHKEWFKGRDEAMCGCTRSKYLDWKLSSCGNRKAPLCEFRAKGDDEVQANCPEGWDTFSGMCYMVKKELMGFNDARDRCQVFGADLVTIGSEAENEFLGDIIKEAVGRETRPLWIGLTDQEKEMEWKFVDGTDWENGFQNWADPQDPYRADKDDCAAITPSSSYRLDWKDRSCSSKYYFICKAKPADVRTFGCTSGSITCPRNADCMSSKKGSICVCKHGYTASMRDGELVSCEKSKICHGEQDPHFTTFDGYRIHFQGVCRYTLAKPCDGAVDAQNMFNVTVQHENRYNKFHVAWVKSVYVEAYGMEIALLPDRQMSVNGDHRHPGIELAGGKIKTELEGCRTLLVSLVDLGVTISFENDHKVRVQVPERYFNKMCGICGNNNDNSDDDKFIAGTTTRGNYFEIGNSWLTYTHPIDLEDDELKGQEDCLDIPEVPILDECTEAQKELYRSEVMCGWLLTSRFTAGHAVLLPTNFIEACVMDLCEGMDIQELMCGTAGSYATEVEQYGVALSWREGTPCAPECPENSVFKSSVSPCADTCQNPDASLECTRAMREGCECIPGYLLSGSKCVPSGECGCMDMQTGTYRQNGDVWTDGRCQHRYTCQTDGSILTEDIACHESAKCKRNRFGKQSCHCQKGYEGDGVTECKDIDECKTRRRPCGRDGVCKNTPGSYTCVLECKPGFRESRGRCKDINECRSDSKGGCSHICRNKVGSYVCQCPVGMSLGEDGHTCNKPKDCSNGVDISDVEPAKGRKSYTRSKPTKDWLKILKKRPGRWNKNKSGSSSSSSSSEELSSTRRKSLKDLLKGRKSGSSSSSSSESGSGSSSRNKRVRGRSSSKSNSRSRSASRNRSSTRRRNSRNRSRKSNSRSRSASRSKSRSRSASRRRNSRSRSASSKSNSRGSKSNSRGSKSNSSSKSRESKRKCKRRKGSKSNSKGSNSNSKGSNSNSKGSNSNGSDSNGSNSNGSDSNGSNSNGSDSNGSDSNGSDSNGSDSKDSDSKDSASQNKDGKGSDSSSDSSDSSSSEEDDEFCDTNKDRRKLQLLAKLKSKQRNFLETVQDKLATIRKRYIPSKRQNWKNFKGKDNGDDDDNETPRVPANGDRDWLRSGDECKAPANLEAEKPIIKGDGFTLNADTGKCQDIDECEIGTDKCPKGSRCKNTIGSYRCICRRGSLVQSKGKLRCEGWSTCRGSGDPHYGTLDGLNIDFMGTCTYTLVKPCPVSKECKVPYFNVEVKNWKKPNRKQTVSYTRYVLVYIGNARIQLGPGRDNVYIRNIGDPQEDEDDIGMQFIMPVENHPDLPGVSIRCSGNYMVVESSFLRVKYDGDERVRASIPSHIYKNVGMCGICGNFNGDDSDDLVDRYGEDLDDLDLDRRERHSLLGESWRVANEDWREGCDVPPDSAEECPTDMAKETVRSDAMCGMLTQLDGVFGDCVAKIMQEKGEDYLDDLSENCYFDLCMNYGNKEDELCHFLASFADICRSLDVNILWRTEDFCPLDCEKRGMVFDPMASACPLTCSNPDSDPSDCDKPEIEACVCKPGMVLSGSKCVKPEQCGCFDLQRGYMTTGSSYITDDCSEIKTCARGGKFHTSPGPKCHDRARCKVRKGVRGCHCKKGWRKGNGIDQCDNEDECSNGRNRCSKNAVCVDTEGSYKCTCRTGFTGDGFICSEIPKCPEGFRREDGDSGDCKDIDECEENANACGPNARCYNAQPGYTCVCKNGMTGDPYSEAGCLGGACVCSARGDPHFKTCDGLSYDYQGKCKYTFTKPCGDIGDLPHFQIDFQTQRYKRSAASTVKYLDISVCGHVITLQQENAMMLDGNPLRAPYTLECDDGHEVEISLGYQRCRTIIVVETDFGLSVTWDGHWNLQVKVSSAYAGKLCGLCGNFDGNPENDPTTQNGTLDAGVLREDRSPFYNEFGDSWRIPGIFDEFCSDEPEPECTKTRYREGKEVCKAMADRRGVLAQCVEAMGRRRSRAALKDCAYDYCMTPDDHVQASICQNFETYIEECEELIEASLEFDWRKEYNCPSVCEDPNMEFKKGASGCPKTCDEPEGPRRCRRPKRDACVCKDGMVLLGNKCVELSACSCLDDFSNFRAIGETWVTQNCTEDCSCTPEGEVCTDRPACAGTGQSCGQDFSGNWGCICEKYYEMNEDGHCVDIDECNKGLDNCHRRADCINRDNGFDCKCKEGFSGNGRRCKKDEEVCVVDGKKYKKGESFNKNACTPCVCDDTLEVVCAVIDCAPSLFCLEEDKNSTECCKPCLKEGCIDMNGEVVELGEMFFPADVCHTQICGDTRVKEVKCEPLMDCDTVIRIPGECCEMCDFGSPPPPPEGCPALNCPVTMGWDLKEFPVKADTRLHILRDMTFDCPGVITRIDYYRSEADGEVYIGVLQPLGDKLRVVGRVTLPAGEVGINSVTLETAEQMSVRRGDMFAVWYPSDAPKGIISLADASKKKYRCFEAGDNKCMSGGEFADVTDADVYDLDVDDELTVGRPNARRALPILIHVESDKMTIGSEVKLTEERKPFVCMSRGNRYNECELNGYAMEIEVICQISQSKCIEGVTYGVRQTKIWVDSGCRAKFRVKFCRVSSNCADGYEFSAQEGKCVDINECRRSRDICPRGSPCLNTEGGYKCLGYCGISGDPHYYTFDGVKLNFQGECTYTLVKPCPVSEETSIPWFDIRSENSGDEKEPVSWTKRLLVTIGEYDFIIEDGPTIYINGEKCSNQFELVSQGQTIKGSMKGCYFVIETSFDLYIYYNPRRKNIKILLPEEYKNIGMCGMCGNYDGNKENDLVTSYGKPVGDLTEAEYSTLIGNSWQTDDSIVCASPPPPACADEVKNVLKDKSNCGKMIDRTGPFGACYEAMPTIVDNMYEQCVYDGCLVPDDNTEQLCNALTALYDACIDHQIEPKWNKQENCPVKCGENEKYESEREICEPTCLSLSGNEETCVDNAMEGCFCVEGYVRSGAKCVKKEECGCSHNGVYYEPGVVLETCKNKLTCTNGKMEESDYTHPCEEGEVCKMKSGKHTCVCDKENGYYRRDGKCSKTTCKEGQKQFRGRCYEIPDEKLPYNPAREYCYKNKGQMVIITDRKLNKFVKSLLEEKKVRKAYIGLDDQLEEGSFVWSNNQMLKAGDYTAWESNAPFASRSVDDCVIMTRFTGEWKDIYCSEEISFICEYGDFVPDQYQCTC